MLGNSLINTQEYAPGWNVLPIVLSVVAWMALIVSTLSFIGAASDNFAADGGATLFAGFLFFALSQGLGRL
jgi:hypothetical protein